jgi:hypothetical protein
VSWKSLISWSRRRRAFRYLSDSAVDSYVRRAYNMERHCTHSIALDIVFAGFDTKREHCPSFFATWLFRIPVHLSV